MIKTFVASVAIALAPAAGIAQVTTLVAPNCVGFVQEGTNGYVPFCFKTPLTPGSRIALDEMLARDKVQAERHQRIATECGTAGQFGMADTAEARACRARIARDLPFPPASDGTLGLLQSHGLSWE